MEQRFTPQGQKHNLPKQPTPFIGRDSEISEISEMLTNPNCRLLTLVGPGGIGKTRLTLEVGNRFLNRFADGVFFVPLAALRSVDMLASTIADSLGLALRGQESPDVQLIDNLHNKTVLLILDNIEHLLNQPGIEFISDMLQQCHEVKLLVTSREMLHLQEEWLFYVQGLPIPTQSSLATATTEEPLPNLESYTAIQLFVQRAQQVQPGFLLENERAHIIRICRLVEGMPLAIELAASWVRMLECAEIASEIQQNVDFLESNLRNVPLHHRSMQAVFNQSWQLLSNREQNVFMRLSVFRGDFDREAAKAVAGASLPVLSMLMDKSLLRPESNGRYHIHELLRQFGAEQLTQSPEDEAAVTQLHSQYYLKLLAHHHNDIKSGNQREATEEIAIELENIRVAWQWALKHTITENISQAADTLQYFYQFQSRFLEGAEVFESTAQAFGKVGPDGQLTHIAAEVLIHQAWFNIRLGQLEKAEMALKQSHSIFNQLKISHPPYAGTDPLTALGTLANIRGNYTLAEKLGHEARQINEVNNDQGNLMDSYYVLTNAAFAQGQFETARKYGWRACTLAETINDRWMMAYILSDLGNIERALGNYGQAKQHYQASYTIKDEFHDPEGKASALNHLGQVAMLEEDYAEAKKLYQRSLIFYQDINDRGGLATTLKGLGMVECALDNCQAASTHYQQALQITTDMQFVPLTLSILIGIGEMFLQTDRMDYGLELLALALHHSAADRETKDRAKKCLDHFQAQVSSDVFETAVQRGQTANLETIIPTVQVKLSTAPPSTDVETQPAANSQPQSLPDQSGLIEPLTARELEVLQLMAQGHTNQQIAEALIISVGTAKWYTGQIYGKLGVSNRTQAVAHARELNLLT